MFIFMNFFLFKSDSNRTDLNISFEFIAPKDILAFLLAIIAIGSNFSEIVTQLEKKHR